MSGAQDEAAPMPTAYEVTSLSYIWKYFESNVMNCYELLEFWWLPSVKSGWLCCFVVMILLCAPFSTSLVQPTGHYDTDGGTRGATQEIEETCSRLRISKGIKRKRNGERCHLCCGMF